MKRLSIFFFPVLCGSLLMTGCEEDAGGDQNQNQSNVSVVAKADQSPQTEAVATRSTNATATGTVVTDAKISLNEFELEMLNLSVSLDVLSELEIELKQPRIITLVADGEAKSEIIAEGKLENGVYSEAEFSYYKNLTVEASDEMYGKSILVKGTWNGAPFVCWTDEENEVEIDFEDEGITVEGSQEINVIFHVNRLVSEIDFSLAVDGNADGVIEIGPEGVDGNTALYTTIKAGLRGMAQL